MKTDAVIQHFGGVSKLAQALGISRKAIYQWGEEPPEGRQYQIQLMTSGKFRATKDSAHQAA